MEDPVLNQLTQELNLMSAPVESSQAEGCLSSESQEVDSGFKDRKQRLLNLEGEIKCIRAYYQSHLNDYPMHPQNIAMRGKRLKRIYAIQEEWDKVYALYEKDPEISSTEEEWDTVYAYFDEDPEISATDLEKETQSAVVEEVEPRRRVSEFPNFPYWNFTEGTSTSIICLLSVCALLTALFTSEERELLKQSSPIQTEWARVQLMAFAEGLGDRSLTENIQCYSIGAVHGLRDMKEACGERLREGMTVENAWVVQRTALVHRDPDLMKLAVDFVRNQKEVAEWEVAKNNATEKAFKLMRKLFAGLMDMREEWKM